MDDLFINTMKNIGILMMLTNLILDNLKIPCILVATLHTIKEI